MRGVKISERETHWSRSRLPKNTPSYQYRHPGDIRKESTGQNMLSPRHVCSCRLRGARWLDSSQGLASGFPVQDP